MQTALIALAAYLLGSISFAVVVSRLMGLPDPHSYGSKNPGATNVLRSGSKLAAVLTLVGDTGKGVLAVFLAAQFTGEDPAIGYDAPIAGAMALLGHLYPVFHGFLGGKGVATAAGVLLALNPWLGLGVLATFAIIIAFFRMVSLASMIAAGVSFAAVQFTPWAALAVVVCLDCSIAALVLSCSSLSVRLTVVVAF